MGAGPAVMARVWLEVGSIDRRRAFRTWPGAAGLAAVQLLPAARRAPVVRRRLPAARLQGWAGRTAAWAGRSYREVAERRARRAPPSPPAPVRSGACHRGLRAVGQGQGPAEGDPPEARPAWHSRAR